MSDLLRQLAHAAGWIDAYYENPRRFPVLSARAGRVDARRCRQARRRNPNRSSRSSPISSGLIVPGITHWNHPRFFAYFAISSAPIAVVAEALTAALDVNAMLWRTSPAATELEEVVLGWLRELLGLAGRFQRHRLRHRLDLGLYGACRGARVARSRHPRTRHGGTCGLAGVARLPHRAYALAHREGCDRARPRPRERRASPGRRKLRDAARTRSTRCCARDLAAGMRPMCVAATVGTTSTTRSIPFRAIAEIAREHGVWLHVDAAYAGPAAILPEFRYLLDGCERADSLVLNPHKWMFVPIDFSVLYVRDPGSRAARLQPSRGLSCRLPRRACATTWTTACSLAGAFARLSSGSCFARTARAASAKRLRAHIALAQEFAGWVEAARGWEILAPHPLSVVCFRFAPPGSRRRPKSTLANARILERANAGRRDLHLVDASSGPHGAAPCDRQRTHLA